MTEKDVEAYSGNPKREPIPKEKIESARPQVVACAKLGCTDKEIGTIVGMSESSIKRHLKDELDEGRAALAGGLRKAQIEAAVKEKNPTMLIWLGKCYLGQKEPKFNHEVSGKFIIEKKIFHANADKD